MSVVAVVVVAAVDVAVACVVVAGVVGCTCDIGHRWYLRPEPQTNCKRHASTQVVAAMVLADVELQVVIVGSGGAVAVGFVVLAEVAAV